MKKSLLLIPSMMAVSTMPFMSMISCNEPEEHDYEKDYFTIEAVTNGKLSCDIDDDYVGETKVSLDLWYSINDGQWTKLEPNFKSKEYKNYVKFSGNDIIRLKGNNKTWSCVDYSITGEWYTTLSFYGVVNLSGNIMSLLYGDDFYGQTTIPCGGCFDQALTSYGVFPDQDREKSSLIYKAENLILPATDLTPFCYEDMFEIQKQMVSSPKVLPANTLEDNCYDGMFDCCYQLQTTPKLLATQLAKKCCQFMFSDCYELTSAPNLPATELVEGCYHYMFSHCQSLKVEEQGDDNKIIFTCPAVFPQTAVSHMFSDTGGTIKTDPVANHTYYWA